MTETARIGKVKIIGQHLYKEDCVQWTVWVRASYRLIPDAHHDYVDIRDEAGTMVATIYVTEVVE